MSDQNQICVWPATVIPAGEEEEFKQFIKEEMGGVVGTVEQVLTLPDKDANGNDVPDTGGRNDIFFSIEEGTNLGRFAITRLGYGIRWWEDVHGNGRADIYPQEILDKYPKTW